MARCPFYGCRWPERSPNLQPSESDNECGLDVENHEVCFMHKQGRTIDFFSCPVADASRAMFTVAEHIISFPTEPARITLREWKKRNRR